MLRYDARATVQSRACTSLGFFSRRGRRSLGRALFHGIHQKPSASTVRGAEYETRHSWNADSFRALDTRIYRALYLREKVERDGGDCRPSGEYRQLDVLVCDGGCLSSNSFGIERLRLQVKFDVLGWSLLLFKFYQSHRDRVSTWRESFGAKGLIPRPERGCRFQPFQFLGATRRW